MVRARSYLVRRPSGQQTTTQKTAEYQRVICGTFLAQLLLLLKLPKTHGHFDPDATRAKNAGQSAWPYYHPMEELRCQSKL